jgi:hypothetical protein
MPDLAQERARLVQVDRHIAEGTQRVTDQAARIAWMTQRGYDPAVSEDLLRNLKQALAQAHAHQRLILDTIAGATAGSI